MTITSLPKFRGLIVTSVLPMGRGVVVNSSICCPDDLGHRDVTTSEARDFAEFSKMALANLLDTRSTNSFFVLDQLSAVLVFLWNRNLGSLFRYR